MHQRGLSEQGDVTSILGPRSDGELITRAHSILRWKIRYNSVNVGVQNGHVTLSGNVLSCLDREAAEQTVRKLSGVVKFTNRIVITSPNTAWSAQHAPAGPCCICSRAIARWPISTLPLLALNGHFLQAAACPLWRAKRTTGARSLMPAPPQSEPLAYAEHLSPGVIARRRSSPSCRRKARPPR